MQQAGDWLARNQLSLKGPGGLDGRQAERESRMCHFNNESQPHQTRGHQYQYSRQVEGSDYSPLFSACQATSGIMHLLLAPRKYEKATDKLEQYLVGGHQRGQEFVMFKERRRELDLFSPKKRRLGWNVTGALNYLMGVTETTELLRGAQREMTRGTRHNLYQGKFLVCLRNKFFPQREMQS